MHEPITVEPMALYDDGALHMLLGLTPASLAKARHGGALRYSRKGKRILYRGQWILDWIAVNEAAAERCGIQQEQGSKNECVCTAPSRWKSLPQLAEQLGVDPCKISSWIQSGELLAFNIATRVGGRPRWRIAPEDLAEFLQRRRASAPRLPRQRRRRSEDVIEFF